MTHAFPSTDPTAVSPPCARRLQTCRELNSDRLHFVAPVDFEMSAQRISESADLGADWQNQSKKEDDDHLNHPTNVAIRETIALKEKGNADFGRHSYDEAVDSYAAGAAAAATVEGNYRAQVAKDLRTACLCNAAQARLKQERWLDASELCTQALSVDGRCVKALFRRGCAHLATKDYDKARRDLELAAEIEPKNQSIASKVRSLRRAHSRLLAEAAPATTTHSACERARSPRCAAG